jgi:hypothetical protein
MQKIAQRRTKLFVQRPPIESESGNDRAECRLKLRDTHVGWHGGFRNEPDGVGRGRHFRAPFPVAAASVNLEFDSAGFFDPEQACRTPLARMLDMKSGDLQPSI